MGNKSKPPELPVKVDRRNMPYKKALPVIERVATEFRPKLAIPAYI